MKLGAAQIEEWLKSPVTRVLLLQLSEQEGELLNARAQVFFPQEAQRTQEVIIEMEARLHELRRLIDRLSSRDGFVEALEETEDEQVWNLPRGLSRTGETGTH